MSGPKTTVWALDPHTKAKHVLLQRYLHAWLPIISRTSGRVVFIDGFSGPGVYEGGEEGSPVIALRALTDHAHKQSISAAVQFLFFEADKARADRLESVIEPMLPLLPPGATVSVMHGEYATLLSKALDELESDGKRLAPSLVFIDPFGVSGLPMSLVRRVLATRSCEVLINVMTGYIHRFVASPEFEAHLDLIYGTDQWRDARHLAGAERIERLRRLYLDELSRPGVTGRAEFVRMFSMLNTKNQPIYDLVFATNHPLGIDRMKDAMWKVDPTGGERFSDATDPSQATILSDGEAHDAGLIAMLRDSFSGQTVNWAVVEERIRRSPFRILKRPIIRASKDPASGLSIESVGRSIHPTTCIRFS